MGRARKRPSNAIDGAEDSPPKRKRGRPPKKNICRKDLSASENVVKCSICLDSTRYRKMEPLRCGHTFHQQCIIKWRETNQKRPLCEMATGQEHAKQETNESNNNDRHYDLNESNNNRHSELNESKSSDRHSDLNESKSSDRHSELNESKSSDRHSDLNESKSSDRHSDSNESNSSDRDSDSNESNSNDCHSASNGLNSRDRYSDSDSNSYWRKYWSDYYYKIFYPEDSLSHSHFEASDSDSEASEQNHRDRHAG